MAQLHGTRLPPTCVPGGGVSLWSRGVSWGCPRGPRGLDIYRGVVKASCRARVEGSCGGARRERHLVANRETLPAAPSVTAGPCSPKSNAPLHRPARGGKWRGEKRRMIWKRNKGKECGGWDKVRKKGNCLGFCFLKCYLRVFFCFLRRRR